jgi:hypothetical protein
VLRIDDESSLHGFRGVVEKSAFPQHGCHANKGVSRSHLVVVAIFS